MSEYLAARRPSPKDGGLSTASSNYYLVAIKGFCRWMVRERRMHDNPVAYLQGGNIKMERHHDRRALLPAELLQSLTATKASEKTYRKLTGLADAVPDGVRDWLSLW